MSTVAADGSLLVTFVDSGDTTVHGRWAADGSTRVTVTNPTSSSPTGTTTNDDAAAGRVGEYLSNSASGVSLTHNIAANITSLSLTAGDWDVSSVIVFAPAATTVVPFIEGSTGTVSATRQTGLVDRSFFSYPAGNVPANPIAVVLPTKRYSLAATTTIYLVSFQTFSTSTMTASGLISARRVR